MDITDSGMKGMFSDGVSSGIDGLGWVGMNYWLLILLAMVFFIALGVGYLVFKALF